MDLMKYLRNTELKFIGGYLLLSITISFLTAAISSILITTFHFKLYFLDQMKDHGYCYKLIYGCLLGPLIETYFFQSLPYEYLSKKNASQTTIILTSATLFGLTHFYSLIHILRAFFQGIILIIAYIKWKQVKRGKFLMVSIIHALHNFFFLILSLFGVT